MTAAVPYNVPHPGQKTLRDDALVDADDVHPKILLKRPRHLKSDFGKESLAQDGGSVVNEIPLASC